MHCHLIFMKKGRIESRYLYDLTCHFGSYIVKIIIMNYLDIMTHQIVLIRKDNYQQKRTKERANTK